MSENKKTEDKKEGSTVDVIAYDGRTPIDYVPEGFESQEDFLQEMREEYQADLTFDRLNREQALDDKKFALGEQWDPLVLEQRKGLPCLVINSIPQFTAQLVGDWRESRKAIKVIPSNDEDKNVAEIRSDLIRSIEMESRASRTYDSAFESLVQCGDGAFRICVEYAKNNVFDQEIRIGDIEDCLSAVWDRFSTDPTGRDARRVWVDDRIPTKEFRRKYKDVDPDELMSDITLRDLSSEGWVDQDSYRITEYWRLIERQRIMAMFENGKVFELKEETMDDLIAANGPPVKTRLAWVTFAQMHLTTGFKILSGPYEYQLNRLPIIRMSGRVGNIKGRRVRYGLVRFMKDAARLKNFWRSVAAEQLGYAPKAKWIGPESAFEGREDLFRQAHLTRDPLLIYNDGAEAPPELIPPPPVEASLLAEASQNSQDMKDVTGIHDASLGMRSNETSGRAIQARQREGDIASLTFYDNANAAILEAGDVINQLIPQIYDGTRIIRTIGEDEKQKFVAINDPMNPAAIDMSIGQFDVALGTGTSYTTKRAEAAQAMMEAIQVFPQLMAIAGPEIIRAQDWAGADKIAEKMEQAQQQAQFDPEEIRKGMEELQKLRAENQALKLDKSIEAEKLKIDAYNAETQRIRALSDHEVDGNQMEMDAIKTILEGSKALDEMEIKKSDIEAKHEIARNKPSTPAGKSTSSPGGSKSQ